MPYSRLYAFLFRHWWLAFLLMGLSFVLFGLVTLDLLHTLGANFTFLSTYGADAVREGGLVQLVQMIVSGYFAAASYVVFKLCEKILVERLAVNKKGKRFVKIAILPGDGIGTEIVSQAVRVLEVLDLNLETEYALVGGAAYEAHGHPLPESTLKLAQAADAVLFGAVGDWKYDKLERALRPEQAILGLRKHLGLFANFRPAICYEQLTHASSLKPELVAGLDILIIRELTGDIYFGQPRGRRKAPDGAFAGAEEAFDTMRYTRPEIERIAHVAFQAARQRRKRLTSVDKANVLETFQFWKDVVTEVHAHYPDVALDHMYVDNAAMQLVKAPKKFDVVVTGNMFGDILSDEAAMLTGSIGMLPSASLNQSGKGLYEPSHGSAPDIAGKDMANPLATILSAAMMLRFSLHQPEAADRIESAVQTVLAAGLRTADIWSEGTTKVGTREMGAAVVAAVSGSTTEKIITKS